MKTILRVALAALLALLVTGCGTSGNDDVRSAPNTDEGGTTARPRLVATAATSTPPPGEIAFGYYFAPASGRAGVHGAGWRRAVDDAFEVDGPSS